jgi:hypothetical protein
MRAGRSNERTTRARRDLRANVSMLRNLSAIW